MFTVTRSLALVAMALFALGGCSRAEATGNPHRTHSTTSSTSANAGATSAAQTTGGSNTTGVQSGTTAHENRGATSTSGSSSGASGGATATVPSHVTDTSSSSRGTMGSNAQDTQRGGGPVTLNDSEVAAILHALDTGEVQQGQFALAHATNRQVRDFAQHMVDQHTASMQSMTQLVQRIHVTPAENQLSAQLTSQSQGVLQSLQGRTGADFDRAYMDAQVTGHHDGLQMIDTRLIPNTHNQEMRRAIEQQVRPMVSDHLSMARRVVNSLGR